LPPQMREKEWCLAVKEIGAPNAALG